MTSSVTNWWTDVLVFLVVLGYLITSWLDWSLVYKSYSPLALPRNLQYLLGAMGIVALILLYTTIKMYPY